MPFNAVIGQHQPVPCMRLDGSKTGCNIVCWRWQQGFIEGLRTGAPARLPFRRGWRPQQHLWWRQRWGATPRSRPRAFRPAMIRSPVSPCESLSVSQSVMTGKK